jgi:NAD(P)-dependent dehydrogenase (short-subunit alcohol dehydrogenase family)
MNIRNLFNLKGKVILVSGGAGLYGQCISEGLAEADGTVIIASRNLDKCKAVAHDFCEKGLDVHALEVDQSDHDSVIRLKNDILDKFGRLDVFVNNSVARPMKSYEDSLANFDRSMKVNATGMMDILREMGELICRNETGGSIINISSMMGMFGPDISNYEGTDMGCPPPDYFFHNAGLINLTRYLARFFAGKNVRVNCVSPGGLFNNQPERFIENYCKKVPLGRMANRDDIKGLMVLLASDAGAYINGENILMDGGMHA